MFDHVTIRVADRAASERLFDALLRPLGVESTYRTSSFTEWREFSLAGAEAAHPATSGLHVGFVAPSREQVEDFWRTGVDLGLQDDGPPGPRPQYLDDYYGSFLRDPDGNSIEAVHYGDRRRSGIVDHLWIRVADLAAATAFYRLVADAAGFRLGREAPDRTSFSGADGASFSLVAGRPTEHLHLAFPGDENAVRRFYEDAVAAGHRGNGEPGERPQYHPGYYAAYVLDPDGNNVEVVDHHRG